MRKLAAIEYVSLDGVVQAPGHAAEDPEGGFEHGGWTAPFMAEHRRYISESFQTVDAFLLGRITYEIFAAVWVLGSVSRSLHHAVEGDVFDGGESSHRAKNFRKAGAIASGATLCG